MYFTSFSVPSQAYCLAVAPFLKCPEEYRVLYEYHPEVNVTVKIQQTILCTIQRIQRRKTIQKEKHHLHTNSKHRPMEYDLDCSLFQMGKAY